MPQHDYLCASTREGRRQFDADHAPYPGMTIFDGVGGVIALALSPGELGRFVEAYRWLAANTLDGGVGTIKVALGAKTYLLHRRPMAGNNMVLRIMNMYDPGEQVVLSSDLAQVVLTLLEHAREQHNQVAG